MWWKFLDEVGGNCGFSLLWDGAAQVVLLGSIVRSVAVLPAEVMLTFTLPVYL